MQKSVSLQPILLQTSPTHSPLREEQMVNKWLIESGFGTHHLSQKMGNLRWPSTKGCKWRRVNSRCWIMEWEQIVFMGFVFLSPTNGASFFPRHFQFQPFLFSCPREAWEEHLVWFPLEVFCPWIEVGLFFFFAEWWHVSAKLCNSRPIPPLVPEMVIFSCWVEVIALM